MEPEHVSQTHGMLTENSHQLHDDMIKSCQKAKTEMCRSMQITFKLMASTPFTTFYPVTDGERQDPFPPWSQVSQAI